jgi:hypothetical protein
MGEGADAMNAPDDLPGTRDLQTDAMSSAGTDETQDQIREISASIEQTRDQMTRTIDELQQRLSPDHIKAQIREHVREATVGKVEDMAQRASNTMYEVRRNVTDTISANPVPAALVAFGLAWLWMNRRSASPSYGQSYRGAEEYGGWRGQDRYSQDRYGESSSGVVDRARDAISGAADQVQRTGSELVASARDRVSSAIGQAQQTGSELAGRARERMSDIVDRTQQTAGRVMSTAQDQAYQAQQRFNRAMDENPLAVGLVALAAGTAIGLAIPQTRKENEWMGETRDGLVDTAQRVVKDTADQVREAARDVTAGTGGNNELGQPGASSAPGA